MISEERAKLNISENLRRLMDEFGITQMQLAERANVSQPFVHKMLHGKAIPSSLALHNVAEVFGVSSDAIIGNPPEKISVKSA